MGRSASAYDRVRPQFFREVATHLVGLLTIKRDARVLDVATGPGVALSEVWRLHPSAELTGIDLSAPMIEEARSRLAALGGMADLRVMDAEKLEFPDSSFDHVFCGSALYQFPHPDRAASEFDRVLRSGGTVAVSVFAGEDPRWEQKNELFGRYAPDLERVGQRFDRRSLQRLLRSAGFVDVEVSSHHFDFAFADADHWLASAWIHGERRALESMSEQVLREFEAQLPGALASAREADGALHWRPEVVFAVGAGRHAG
jgi:ubiquinone/menaquinone biosynthesis C-methylase UbiE